MSAAPKPARRLPMRGSTLLVLAFLAVTILPAFIASALTPPDARVVTNVQGWNGCTYAVRRGDNLFRIGVRYGVTYHYLAQINGIYNPNYIFAGETISVPCGPVPYYPGNRTWYPPRPCTWCPPFKIPDSCAQTTAQYTVQAGNSLFRIAVQFGSTIQWIRTENELWGKVLRPGKVLTIPCVGEVDYSHVPPLATNTPGGIITQVPPPTPVPGDRVRMRGGQFRPPQRTVRVGTTVTWENTEDPNGPAYTIQSDPIVPPDQAFRSPNAVPPGGTFQNTFNVPGTYPYFSSTFPETMRGEIIVTP